MTITAGTLFFAFAAFLNSIEISSGMPPKTRDFLANFGKISEHDNHQEIPSVIPSKTRDFLAHFGTSQEHANNQDISVQLECLHNSKHIPGGSRCERSSASDGSFPDDTSFSPARPYNPVRSTSPTTSSPAMSSSPATSPSPPESSLRVRSRSPSAAVMAPPTKIEAFHGLYYELDQPQLIRLTSYSNPQRIFVLRRHTFQTNTKIRIHARRNIFVSMPTQEQIVLSTTDGDAFALLKASNFLAGIYSCNGIKNSRARAKINMESGKVTALTKDEIRDVPVGQNSKILLNFKVERSSHNASQQ